MQDAIRNRDIVHKGSLNHLLLRLRLSWHVLSAAAASVVGFLLFARVGEDVFAHESGSFDDAIRMWMLGHRTHALFRGLTWVTNVGSSGPLLSATLVVCIWLWRAKRRYAASGALAAPTVAIALFSAIKFVYGRTRPSGAAYFGLQTFAFPSGHATVSMAAAVAVAFVLWRERLLSGTGAMALAVGVPLLVGFSRVYLDVHWATDVLGGWCVGLFVAGLTCTIYEHLRRDPTFTIPDTPPIPS